WPQDGWCYLGGYRRRPSVLRPTLRCQGGSIHSRDWFCRRSRGGCEGERRDFGKRDLSGGLGGAQDRHAACDVLTIVLVPRVDDVRPGGATQGTAAQAGHDRQKYKPLHGATSTPSMGCPKHPPPVLEPYATSTPEGSEIR